MLSARPHGPLAPHTQGLVPNLPAPARLCSCLHPAGPGCGLSKPPGGAQGGGTWAQGRAGREDQPAEDSGQLPRPSLWGWLKEARAGLWAPEL